MACGVDHAIIEKAKWIYTTLGTDTNLSEHATKINRSMHAELFFDFARFLKGPLQLKKIDEIKKKCYAFKHKKGEFPQFNYKSYDVKEWNIVNLQRKRGKSPPPSVFETECIPWSYDGPIAILNEKKQDLISLLLLINPSVRFFYNNLLSHDDVKYQHPLLNDREDEME